MDSTARLEHITSMLEEFQTSLKEAVELSSNTPVTNSLSILESTFKMFREVVLAELSSIKESLGKMGTLEVRQMELEQRLEEQEQYSRRNCLLLRNVPESQDKGDNEDQCLRHVMQVINQELKLDLSSDVISRCHRLGGKPRPDDGNPDRVRPIIMKFYSYKHRRMVFGAKKLLRGKAHSLTEFLTVQRLKTFRQAKLTHGMQNCWTSDGKILINIDKGGNKSQRVVVKRLEQIPPAVIPPRSDSAPPAGSTPAASIGAPQTPGSTPIVTVTDNQSISTTPIDNGAGKTWDLRSRQRK